MELSAASPRTGNREQSPRGSLQPICPVGDLLQTWKPKLLAIGGQEVPPTRDIKCLSISPLHSTSWPRLDQPGDFLSTNLKNSTLMPFPPGATLGCRGKWLTTSGASFKYPPTIPLPESSQDCSSPRGQCPRRQPTSQRTNDCNNGSTTQWRARNGGSKLKGPLGWQDRRDSRRRSLLKCREDVAAARKLLRSGMLRSKTKGKHPPRHSNSPLGGELNPPHHVHKLNHNTSLRLRSQMIHLTTTTPRPWRRHHDVSSNRLLQRRAARGPG